MTCARKLASNTSSRVSFAVGQSGHITAGSLSGTDDGCSGHARTHSPDTRCHRPQDHASCAPVARITAVGSRARIDRAIKRSALACSPREDNNSFPTARRVNVKDEARASSRCPFGASPQRCAREEHFSERNLLVTTSYDMPTPHHCCCLPVRPSFSSGRRRLVNDSE